MSCALHIHVTKWQLCTIVTEWIILTSKAKHTLPSGLLTWGIQNDHIYNGDFMFCINFSLCPLTKVLPHLQPRKKKHSLLKQSLWGKGEKKSCHREWLHEEHILPSVSQTLKPSFGGKAPYRSYLLSTDTWKTVSQCCEIFPWTSTFSETSIYHLFSKTSIPPVTSSLDISVSRAESTVGP